MTCVTDAQPRVAAIVLAAGLGTRFARETGGASKLLALDRGKPLVRLVVEAALASRARPIIVVTGHARADVRVALADLDFAEVGNPEFAAGLSTSLRAGLAAVPQAADGALVLLGDMPRVTAGHIDRLIDAFARDAGADAVIPTHAGRRGNPVLLNRALFPPVAMLTGDEGARRLLRADARVVEVPSDDDAVAIDIDTPAALRALSRTAGEV